MWRSAVLLDQAQVRGVYDNPDVSKRLASWLSLSVSISALLSLDRPDEYIAALAQLMEEWEFHYANGAVQLMKRIGSKMQGDDDNSTEVKPRCEPRSSALSQ
eukprot:TRINITY_DN11542_c0_g1_i16.p1 TRINITY_DN11542_c0_g1~~TRINITY_DN11542_c0_g1_i16.p1  ORF type:complete len:102 (-),score=24.23 TRINITY_DN11542_c0_g1_i16:725-1030(-)